MIRKGVAQASQNATMSATQSQLEPKVPLKAYQTQMHLEYHRHEAHEFHVVDIIHIAPA